MLQAVEESVRHDDNDPIYLNGLKKQGDDGELALDDAGSKKQ